MEEIRIPNVPMRQKKHLLCSSPIRFDPCFTCFDLLPKEKPFAQEQTSSSKSVRRPFSPYNRASNPLKTRIPLTEIIESDNIQEIKNT
jgi:hypothetical protein